MRPSLFPVLCLLCSLLISCTDYDLNQADSPANKKGFTKHIGFEPSEDITGVYYYADELGADVQYQLHFSCDKLTFEKICEKLGLQIEKADYSALDPRTDLPWWDKESTKDHVIRVFVKEGSHHRELWYSEAKKTAYYHEYSL